MIGLAFRDIEEKGFTVLELIKQTYRLHDPEGLYGFFN